MAEKQRERWVSRTAFIMAAIGSAVGLGNIWRFPRVAFANGGGAFFIPYFVALISAGIPLMIVEYALGQKFQGGAPRALAAVTEKFRWVGWFALLVGTCITFYYVVVMAYAWHYAAASLCVAWTKPAPAYEVKTTEDGVLVRETRPEETKIYLPAQDPTRRALLERSQARQSEQVPVLSEEQVRKRAEAEPEVNYVSIDKNVANYFNNVCLGAFRPDEWGARLAHDKATADKIAELQEQLDQAGDSGQAARLQERIAQMQNSRQGYVRDMFRLTPTLVIGAFVTWLLIFLIIFKGVHNVGRVVMVTVPLPIVLLLILLIRGLTLPGSTTGLMYYLKPNWEMLKDPGVWIAAYGQIFFSLSLGFGILIAYASYMPPESDVTNSAFITSFANCATSFLGGLTVFSVLGYLAYLQGTPDVSGVVSGGVGLVFITYPIALAQMPMADWAIALLSLLFFLCLITLGIDSVFSILEGVVAGFRDRFPRLSRRRLTAVFCSIGFLGSLIFCTRSGLMWLDIVDNWMSNYGLALVGLLECIAVGYFFHLDDLKEYINKHSEIKVHNWFDAFIKVITPAILIYLLGSQFIKDVTETYGGYDTILPWAVTVAGWGLFLVLLALAMVLARDWWVVTAIGCWVVVFACLMGYLRLTAGAGVTLSELVGPAAMGAVALVILFGPLVTCIYIALKTRHMAGLALDAPDNPSASRAD